MEKFPHNQIVIIFPHTGMVESRLVITVAPHKDIWPQGKT
jgi:hypothetical protein